MLVVKKNASVNISNEIGKLLMSDEIKADDVTVSIMREARPDGLQGYSMSNPYKGVGRGKRYLAQNCNYWFSRGNENSRYYCE